jgi:hypothetical protein
MVESSGDCTFAPDHRKLAKSSGAKRIDERIGPVEVEVSSTSPRSYVKALQIAH